MAGLSELYTMLQSADFFTGLLPFIIVFSIFFMVLKQVDIFNENENVTTLISLSFGALASFFILNNPSYSKFVTQFFGYIAVGFIFITGLLSVAVLTGVRGEDENNVGKLIKYGVGGLGVLIVVVAFGVAGGFGPNAGIFASGALRGAFQTGLGLLRTSIETGIIWGILILGAVAFAVSGGGGGNEDAADDDQEEEGRGPLR